MVIQWTFRTVEQPSASARTNINATENNQNNGSKKSSDPPGSFWPRPPEDWAEARLSNAAGVHSHTSSRDATRPQVETTVELLQKQVVDLQKTVLQLQTGQQSYNTAMNKHSTIINKHAAIINKHSTIINKHSTTIGKHNKSIGKSVAYEKTTRKIVRDLQSEVRNQIKNIEALDDASIENIFSFCDFHSAIQVGKTCKRFKKISDNCLDHVVVSIVNGGSKGGTYEMTACTDDIVMLNLKLRKLKQDESCTYTQAGLIQEGIELCNPMDDYPPGHVNFVEGRARYLLHTRGFVETEDFLSAAVFNDDEFYEPYGGMKELYGDYGWSVTIRLLNKNLDLRNLAQEIMRPGWNYNSGYYKGYDEELWEESDSKSKCRTIQYHLLCLLRKADPSSFQRKFVNVDTRDNDYSEGKYRSSISFRVPSAPSKCDNNNDSSNQFEFYYSMERDWE